MVIARSYIFACGRRGAANAASHRARRCGQKEHAGEDPKAAVSLDERLPRARAAVRRWSTFAFEVHAGTYVEVFLIFRVYWRAAWTALSILLEQAARARANRRTSIARSKRAACGTLT